MYCLKITRAYTPRQTTGSFTLAVDCVKKATGVTLELPWKKNGRNISCIPSGIYKLEIYESARFGRCLHVLDVPGRTAILIHSGNYVTDTQGCILPGSQFTDINKDGLIDVTASKATLAVILENIAGEGILIIK